MDLDELKKMTVPKLRERAKEITDLQGVGGMAKDELIAVIAKAEGIRLEAAKDAATIASVKEHIHALRKQKEELHASSADRSKVDRLRNRIKRLKRRTRQMVKEAARQKAVQQAQAVAAEAKTAEPPAGKSPTVEAEASTQAQPASVSTTPKGEAVPQETTVPEPASPPDEETAPAEKPQPDGDPAAEAGPESDTKPAGSN